MSLQIAEFTGKLVGFDDYVSEYTINSSFDDFS
jgi:hypothetical protein